MDERDPERPIFFGGLPPRTPAQPAGESVPVRAANPKRRRLVLISTAAAGAVVLAAATAVTVPMLLGAQVAKTSVAPEEPMSTQEAIAAAEAVASGGAAIPGHIVSKELCDAIEAFGKVGKDVGSSTKVTKKQLKAMKRLAAVESPSRDVYERFVDMVSDPEGVTSIAVAQEIATDFANAVQVDASVCA